MNKKLIAAAVSAAVVAPVASHADAVLYGRINNAIDMNDLLAEGDGTTDISGVASRIGVRANAELNNGMSVHGQYEFATTTDKEGPGVNDTRVATAGVSGDFGRFDVGNQWSAYNETFGTLVSPTYSLGYYLYSSVGGGLFRASNTIQYSNSFGPVTARLDVRLNEDGEGDDVAEKVSGDGIALGLSFAVTDNITIAAAFDSEDGASDIAAVAGRNALVTSDYNPGNEERRGAVTVDVQGASGTDATETTFVAVTTADTGGGNIETAPVTTAAPALGNVIREGKAAVAAGDDPGTDRVGVAVKANFGGYWATLGWQNYSVDENERTGDAEVDVDTMFLYGGGNFSEQTSWLVGFSSADNAADEVADVAGVGSTTATEQVAGSLGSRATDDSSQVTWGIYHNVGGGLRLYYEGTSVEIDNTDDADVVDGTRHLLGMRVDF